MDDQRYSICCTSVDYNHGFYYSNRNEFKYVELICKDYFPVKV